MTGLDAERYVEHLRSSGALAHWPDATAVVATFGPVDAVGSKARRRRKATPTPFGSCRPISDGAILLELRHVGAAATAVVVECLSVLGVERIVAVGRVGRVEDGSGRAGTGAQAAPRVLLVDAANGDDAASVAYGRTGSAEPDPRLLDAIERCCVGRSIAVERGGCWSTDTPFLLHGPNHQAAAEMGWVDMEATTLFAVGRHRGISVALAGVESDLRSGDEWKPLDSEIVDAAMNQVAAACVSLFDGTSG